jgi:hypothetical protein
VTAAPADVTTKVDGMCALAGDPGGSKGPSSFPVGDEAISCPELSSIFMLVACDYKLAVLAGHINFMNV